MASTSGTQRNKLRPISEDAKGAMEPSTSAAASKRLTSRESSFDDDRPERHESRHRFSLDSAVMKVTRSTALLRNWMTGHNKTSLAPTSSMCLDDCLPPMYRDAKNMNKSIKEQKRKLFHSSKYDDETDLKKLYVQTCKRLPAFGCRVFQIKESFRGKTKKKANRILGISVDNVVLLDSKTLQLTKSQVTSDLQQWRSGGGRSQDQLTLEFRATKWSFIASSHGSLRSISSELWEIMQDLDAHFLNDHIIATRQEMDKEVRKSALVHDDIEKTIVYKEELEYLQSQLHFPENVAMKLTEVEYKLFYKVAPIHYIRQVTLDLSHLPVNDDEVTVQSLVKRFKEVSSWVTHIIVSQPTHDDRKAVLSCILRVAMSCWNLYNFNTAMEILAGLKSEKLKPFWLSLSDKDSLVTLDRLTQILFTAEPSPEYRAAIDKALSSPHSRVIPFFGNFLREIRNVLRGVPSIVVLSTGENTKMEFISDYHGEDHFFTKIGVGGIINIDKLRMTHNIVESVQAYHIHAAKQATIEEVNDETEEIENDPRIENESLYEVQADSMYGHVRFNDPGVTFFPIDIQSEEFQTLEFLHHGTTVVHWDEDGSRSASVYLRLEKSNGTITWRKPMWSCLRSAGPLEYNLSANIEDCLPPDAFLKLEGSDVCHNNIDEGFLNLASVKEITMGGGTVDLNAVSKKFALDDLRHDRNCLRLLYGANLSDNRSVEFVAPTLLAESWFHGLQTIIAGLKKQKGLTDRRVFWLKEQFIQVHYEQVTSKGPSSIDTIQYICPFFAQDHSSRLPTDNASNDHACRRQAPSVKNKKSSAKSSHPFYSLASLDICEECLCPTTSKTTPHNGHGPVIGHPMSHIPSTSYTSSYKEKTKQSSSSSADHSLPFLSAPALSHSGQMDFLQFAEIFRSFLVRSRKDIRQLFEKVAVSAKLVYEAQSDENYVAPEGNYECPKKILGILTRNTTFDFGDNKKRKQVCDAIASASVVCNSAGVDTSHTKILGVSEFQEFLAVHQGEMRSEEEVATLIQRHEPDATLRSKLCLSYEGFARYLLDKDNYIFVSETIIPNEDLMNRTMSDYFIASSHNTYLTGHQLKGESSVELYSQVLLTGCRCVELDCWDGDDGMPVIYHGHTLTTKIPFKSVVDAINKSAFVTSPYPVILSIENHCSLQQQAKMAQIFMTTFGERLVTRYLFESDFSEDPLLPSPNQLKYRVLIKNKKMRSTMTPALAIKSKIKLTTGRTNSIISTASTGSFNDEEDDDYEEEEDEDILEENFHPAAAATEHEDRHSSGTVSKSASMTARTESLSSQEGSCKDKPTSFHPSLHKLQSVHSDVIADIVSAEEEKSRKSSSQIASELSDLVVYCQAIKFRGSFMQNASPTNSVKTKKLTGKKSLLGSSSNMPSSDGKGESSHLKKNVTTAPCYQVSSMNESNAKRLCKRHPLPLMQHCGTQLMRTYPAGMRIDSSNFNPVIFWTFGIQMVALNYQTGDSALHINSAMFEQNGRCGYVLKPDVMWDRSHVMYNRFNPWEKSFDGIHSLSISLTLISGQNVCPATHTGSPQIELEVMGIPTDCCRHKSKLVPRNSLNPIWNDKIQFRVTFCDLAFLRFSVMDMATGHVTSQRVIPLSSLRQGYRHLRLRNPHNQPLPLTTLFIHALWEEEGLEGTLDHGELLESVTGGKKSKGKSKDTPVHDLHKDGKEVFIGSIPLKRRTFFLPIHGIAPIEGENTILKITQESTTREVITQSLIKENRPECPDEFVLMEEVHKGWNKKTHDRSMTRRFLDLEERPLEAQSHWQGDGRFIMKKLSDDPSTRAWLTTIRTTANKEKRRQDRGDLNSDELNDWSEGDDAFLVCVFNVSFDHPYTVLKASITSTAQDILAQALIRARRMEDPIKFCLIEHMEYEPFTEPPVTTSRKKGARNDFRILDDFENVFEAQQKWKATGWFQLKEKEPTVVEKKKSTSRCSAFGRLARFSRSSSKAKDKPPATPNRRVKSLHEGNKNIKSNTKKTVATTKATTTITTTSSSSSSTTTTTTTTKTTTTTTTTASTSWKQPPAEGESVSDDGDKETAMLKLKRLSLLKMKLWK